MRKQLLALAFSTLAVLILAGCDDPPAPQIESNSEQRAFKKRPCGPGFLRDQKRLVKVMATASPEEARRKCRTFVMKYGISFSCKDEHGRVINLHRIKNICDKIKIN